MALRVACFNIAIDLYELHSFDVEQKYNQIASFIKTNDVVGLQEMKNYERFKFLETKLGPDWHGYFVSEEHRPEGVGILSRFKLSHIQTHRITRPEDKTFARVALSAQIEHNNMVRPPLRFAVVHLPICAADVKLRILTRLLDDLVAPTTQNEATIVCGDFNCWTRSESQKMDLVFAERNMIDACPASANGTSTFLGTINTSSSIQPRFDRSTPAEKEKTYGIPIAEQCSRIDRFFISYPFIHRMGGYKVSPVYFKHQNSLSDHYAISGTINLEYKKLSQN